MGCNASWQSAINLVYSGLTHRTRNPKLVERARKILGCTGKEANQLPLLVFITGSEHEEGRTDLQWCGSQQRMCNASSLHLEEMQP